MNPATASMLLKRSIECGCAPPKIGDECGGDRLRRSARRLCQRERDVGRKVAEVGASRGLERDGRRGYGVGLRDGECRGTPKCAQRIVAHREQA